MTWRIDTEVLTLVVHSKVYRNCMRSKNLSNNRKKKKFPELKVSMSLQIEKAIILLNRKKGF